MEILYVCVIWNFLVKGWEILLLKKNFILGMREVSMFGNKFNIYIWVWVR